MKNSTKIFLLAAIGGVAITLYLMQKASAKKRLITISDEGYETASDILFPGKQVGNKMHYGPVIPGQG
ncbi:MAG: hypothetical protein V4685_13400 [Bacteroidota bacterium]